MIAINTLTIILFYIGIFVLIYFNRKKFDFQKVAKIPIVSILRTKFGLNWLNKFGTKHSKSLKRIGYVGIIICAIGLILMTYMITSSFVNLFVAPEQPSGVSPVIPGVKIPGAQIFVPFWYGIIALFIVVLIHEAGHGLVAKAHNLKIKSTGFVLFTILPGAFVEPDETKLIKAKKKIQQSVYAAGPWFNIMFAFILIIIMGLVINPIYSNLYNSSGFKFSAIEANSPAEISGLPIETTFNKINDQEILSSYELGKELENYSPGEEITLTTENGINYNVQLTEHPENSDKGYIGILNLYDVKGNQNWIQNILFKITNILMNLFFWTYVLSLGIGAANLLPIGPLDGGRMFHTFLLTKFKDKKAKMISAKISFIILIFLLGALIVPIIKALI